MNPLDRPLSTCLRRLTRARQFLTERREDMARIDLDSTILDLAEAQGVDHRGVETIRALLAEAERRGNAKSEAEPDAGRYSLAGEIHVR